MEDNTMTDPTPTTDDLMARIDAFLAVSMDDYYRRDAPGGVLMSISPVDGGPVRLYRDDIADLYAEVRALRDQRDTATHIIHRYQDGWHHAYRANGEMAWRKTNWHPAKWEPLTDAERAVLAAVDRAPTGTPDTGHSPVNEGRAARRRQMLADATGTPDTGDDT
jgi:hypothetical protein